MSDSIIQNTTEGITVTDSEGIILKVNQAFTDITGYSEEEALGKNPRILKSDRHNEAFYKQMWDALLTDGCWAGEIWNRRKDGRDYPEWLSINNIKENNVIKYFVAVFHDISDIKKNEAQLEYHAYHDVLTGLPNRQKLIERLNSAIVGAKRESSLMGLFFLDLDNFKNINDSLGHLTGDKFLVEISRRLKETCRIEDTLARLGGDEFVILLPRISSKIDAMKIVHRIMESIKQPFMFDEHEIIPGTSIGITFYPEDGNDSITLLKNADMAMYKAKKSGKNKYSFFSKSMNDKALQRITLETKLRHALGNDEFRVFYQPKVDTITNKIVGAEALVRWIDEEGHVISPGVFIPLAEESGLIVPIGESVMKQAVKAARNIVALGYEDFQIAVNLSIRQFSDPDLIEMINSSLIDSGLKPQNLELEITESMLMTDVRQAMDLLSSITGMGITISIDDFGTGYSSLSYLKKFSADTLKIDRSFVMDLPQSDDASKIALSIISLAKNLGMKVVAEGIETAEQLEFMKINDCEYVQGYYFSKPLPTEEFLDYLHNHNNDSSVIG